MTMGTTMSFATGTGGFPINMGATNPPPNPGEKNVHTIMYV